jgi:hypothetical protein
LAVAYPDDIRERARALRVGQHLTIDESAGRMALPRTTPAVVELSARWLTRLSARPMICSVRYHADQDLGEIQAFWGDLLGVEPSSIRLQRKSDSGQFAGRRRRSPHGVVALRVNDTLFRARMQAWMDRVRDDWRLDSATGNGV